MDCEISGIEIVDDERAKRGGLRVIYYWWLNGSHFWLFTVYDKDEVTDLTATQKKALKALLESEVVARSQVSDEEA